MSELIGSPWTGALAAIVVLLLLVVLWRYRALERRGTPLPPGAGGARMVGTIGTVVADHEPGTRRGHVRVLGEDWGIADEVDQPLPVGATVRVERVTGTRLVVTRLPAGHADEAAPEADDPRRS